MFYKINYILLSLCLSVLISQSNFNRLIGEDIFLGDARSMGIGNSFLTTGTSGSLILSNPSRISQFKDNFIINGQLNGRMNNERKGIVVKDFFDDIITESDFAFNQNTYYNTSFNVIFTRPLSEGVRLGLAYADIPLLSFNYNYIEEVRGDADNADTFIGSSDPLLGYQILNNEGEVSLSSLGLSLSTNNLDYGEISFGIGINRVKPSQMRDYYYINIINNTEDLSNLSNLDPFINIFNISSEQSHFLTYSITFPILKNITTVFAFEEDIDISSANYIDYQLSPYIGLPTIISFDDDNKLHYSLIGLHYNKPEKYSLGLTYKPASKHALLITFEATKKLKKHYLSEWNCSNVLGTPFICNENDTDAFLENIVQKEKLFEFKLGFEHFLIYGFPIRAGYEYKENSFNFDATSIFTLGTGKTFKTITETINSIDFAINYTMNNYRYYDIFPIQTNVFDNVCLDDVKCNNVKESSLSFLTTFKIGF